MKIIFEYVFKDICYDEVEISNERFIEFDIKNNEEVLLPPCNKKIEITLCKDGCTIKLSPSLKIKVNKEKVPFKYEESYELFEDLRYMELEGFCWIKE